jgi:hypothetical protein
MATAKKRVYKKKVAVEGDDEAKAVKEPTEYSHKTFEEETKSNCMKIPVEMWPDLMYGSRIAARLRNGTTYIGYVGENADGTINIRTGKEIANFCRYSDIEGIWKPWTAAIAMEMKMLIASFTQIEDRLKALERR